MLETESISDLTHRQIRIGKFHFGSCDEFFMDMLLGVQASQRFQQATHFVKSSKKNLLAKTDVVFVILDHEGLFIGCYGIHKIKPISTEVGLWLKEESQNQGFGTEAIIALIEFIEQYFSIEYIIYPIDKENIRSRKIPEKLGFTVFKTYNQQKNELINLNIIEYRKYYAS